MFAWSVISSYKIYIIVYGVTQGDCIKNSIYIKTESIRKLSNFNFQWTKTLYQNNLKNIAFFFTFVKG